MEFAFAIECDGGPCHIDPLMLPARTLIDDLLAQRLLGLSHSWYDEDPPLLGRLVLQPLMWGGYAFMVWLLSLGNVSGAGPCWLLISICVTVYAVAALDKSLLDVFVASPFARNVHTQRATRREMRAVQREHLAPKTVGQAEIYDLIIVGVASLVRLAYMAMFVLYVFSFVATVCSALCNASSSSRESRWRRLTKRVKSGAEVVRRFAARLIGIPQEMELPVMLLVAAAIAILLNVVVATVVLRGPVNHAESMAEQLAEGAEALREELQAGLDARGGGLIIGCQAAVQHLEWIVQTFLPAFKSLVKPTLSSASYGLATGAIFGVGLTLHGVIDTFRTYASLYEFFDRASPAQLRFPLFRPDAVRLVSSIVAYNFFGLMLMCGFGTMNGVGFACLWYDWPWAATLRRSFCSALAALAFYLLFVAPLITPLCQRCSSGPALFVIEMWYLSTGLIKAYFRLILLLLFATQSFFYPACNQLPDGYECWDSGHVTFSAFVMERLEQDRYGQRRKPASHEGEAGGPLPGTVAPTNAVANGRDGRRSLR